MFICIEKNPDGSHAFQIGGSLEDGWAAVPDEMSIPDTFPYVEIETAMVTHSAIIDIRKKTVNGEIVEEPVVIVPEYTQMEVVAMTEGEEIQNDNSGIEPLTPDTITDAEAAAAIREGVDSV